MEIAGEPVTQGAQVDRSLAVAVVGFIVGLLGFGIEIGDSILRENGARAIGDNPRSRPLSFGRGPSACAVPVHVLAAGLPDRDRARSRRGRAGSRSAIADGPRSGRAQDPPDQVRPLGLDRDVGVGRAVDPTSPTGNVGVSPRKSRLAAIVSSRPSSGRADVERAAAVVLERDQPAARLRDLELPGRRGRPVGGGVGGAPAVRLGDHRRDVPDDRRALALGDRPLLGRRRSRGRRRGRCPRRGCGACRCCPVCS